MAIQLVRRPGVEGLDPANPAAGRAWIRDHVREEVTCIGQAHPKIYLLGPGFVETFDLDAMAKREPGADLGATFHALRQRSGVQRCFLVMQAQGETDDGAELTWAVVFEELRIGGKPHWWMGMLPYDTDPATGLGRVLGDWQLPKADTADPAVLPPFVRPVAQPRPGARPADIRDASAKWEPDIRMIFGELDADPPADADGMVALVSALGLPRGLLDGTLQGVVVVRIAGRSWEVFQLVGDMPASTIEMVRWIANHRLPAADGVALAQIAIRTPESPPIVGVQVVAEKGGMFVETWAPITFPEGPKGPKVVTEIRTWPARPVPDAMRWLGVRSSAPIEDGAPQA